MDIQHDKCSIYIAIFNFIANEIKKNPNRVFYLDEKFIGNDLMDKYHTDIRNMISFECILCRQDPINEGMSPNYPEIPRIGYIFEIPANAREKLAILLQPKSE